MYYSLYGTKNYDIIVKLSYGKLLQIYQTTQKYSMVESFKKMFVWCIQKGKKVEHSQEKFLEIMINYFGMYFRISPP